jgi:hypothetical protein
VSPNTEDSDENLKMLGVTVDVAYIAFTGDYDSSWTYQGDDLIQSQVKPGNTGKLVISGLPKNISIKKINATMNGGPLYTKGSIKVEAGEDEIAFLELGTRRTDVPTKITGKKTDYPLNMTTTSVNNDETDLTISLNCESGEYMYLYALEIYYTLNDVPTKIEKTTANIQEGKIYYNLQGQRVNNPSKGIYIVDGKKILIK